MDYLLRRYRLLWAAVAIAAAWFLVRLPLPWAGLLVFGLPFLLWMVTEPLVGVGAALFVAPWGAYLAAYFPAVPPRLGDLLLGATLGLWLLGLLARRETHLPLPPLLGPLLLFLGVALLSLARPVDAWMGGLEWMKWVEMTALFLLLWERWERLGGQWEALRLPLAALMLLLLFQAGMGLWQFALRGDGPPHFAIREGLYRAYGTFEQPNPFAGLMGMGAALFGGMAAGWGLAWLGGERPVPLWSILAAATVALAALVALIASWSRGGWMGFAAALGVMVAAFLFAEGDLPRSSDGGRRRWWAALGTLAVALSAPTLWTHLPASLRDRLTGFLAYTRFQDVRGLPINAQNYAVMERMAHWQAALGMWRDHFWLGVGLGCYEAAYGDYRLINWPIALGHAHNIYLTLLAETGLFGLVSYLVLFAQLLFRLARTLPRLAQRERALAVGLLGAWSHFLVHNLVDSLMVNGVQMVLGLLLALSAWVIARAADGEASAAV